ncbi:competence protein CoiA family protein [Halomonas sp. I5-271120]|uniref:competence protein CoiA family protein n=1 Tax=Halomonas sp. I5-271120 TaxID=3061632 RepID=UPI002714F991|nr:competence protein CoiA family protein [Halomonas sp. I5-271120]
MHTPSCNATTSSELKVPYGLRDNVLVHISEIQPGKRGLACQCICPACQHALIANLGTKKRHYFSHAAQSDCAGAAETGLHLKAKELIAEKQQTVLPELTLRVGSDFSEQALHEGRSEIATLVEKGQVARLDTVMVEEARGVIRPDLIGVLAGTELYIEIRVTHEVDEEKRAEIRRLGVSAIEIDLSGINRMASPQEIGKALADPSLGHWLFHRREDSQREAMEERVRQAQARAREAKQREAAKRQQRKDAFKQRLNHLFRALNQCLMEGAPIQLPEPRQPYGQPQVRLPKGFGAGLSIHAANEDWMVWATRTDPQGQQEHFIIAWHLHNPEQRRPYRLNQLFDLDESFCMVDVSPLINGRFQSNWSRRELTAFLTGHRPRHDHWYCYPASVATDMHRFKYERQQQERAAAKGRKAEEERLREARLAEIRAAQLAQDRKQAQVAEQIRDDERKQEARYRDSNLKRELAKLAALTSKGEAIRQQVLERLELIQSAREDSDTPLPARWLPAKVISSKYPTLAQARPEWIDGQWRAVARAYPYEWAFTVHPDCLKIAVLDSLLASTEGDLRSMEKAELMEALQAALKVRVEETRQPGAQIKGYAALYVQMKSWSSEFESLVKRIQEWYQMTCRGEPLPESALTRETITELDKALDLLASAPATGESIYTNGDTWPQLDAVRGFCAALADDLSSDHGRLGF